VSRRIFTKTRLKKDSIKWRSRSQKLNYWKSNFLRLELRKLRSQTS